MPDACLTGIVAAVNGGRRYKKELQPERGLAKLIIFCIFPVLKQEK
jgi:hypothetical protein